MDLPTYTNIWRIEKRLYKLYDFRLPAPLPITWIAVFAGITVPYVVFLVAIGLPFNHNLVWLYILPPGLLTWLTTRPVIENKRLPELVSSQLRYLAEPRTWCRLAPFSEKDHVALSARVWHRHPAQARTEQTEKSRGPARSRDAARPARARPAAGASVPVVASPRPSRPPRARRQPVSAQLAAEPAAAQPAPAMTPMTPVPPPAQPASGRAAAQVPVPQRATASPPARATPPGRAWPRQTEPDTPAGDPPPGALVRPAWLASPADRRQDSLALEVAHDPEPDPRDLGEPRPVSHAPPSWPPPTGTFPIPGAVPEPVPFPEAGPFPEAAAFPEAEAEVSPRPEATAFPGLELMPEADPAPEPEPAVRAETAPAPAPAAVAFPAPAHVTPTTTPPVPATATPAPATAVPATPGRSVAARVAALFVDLDADRPLPSVERALSGPGSGDASWHRRVKVVTGGQGPGQQDREALDRDRARQPLAGPRLILVLGCTSGAGQSVTALMTGLILAALRDAPVAALDLNPGDTSLAARIAPAATATALLAGEVPGPQDRAAVEARPPSEHGRARSGRRLSAARLDVIAADPPGANGVLKDGAAYGQLASALGARYPLTMIDPAPSRLARALSVADQLVLVAPVSPEAATALAHIQMWLGAHGYGEIAARAVTVINGVGRRPGEDVLRAESVARGRGRAIVRVPWDDQLPLHLDGLSALDPQTRLAYTALAGVLVSGLDPRTANREARAQGRSPGGHSD